MLPKKPAPPVQNDKSYYMHLATLHEIKILLFIHDRSSFYCGTHLMPTKEQYVRFTLLGHLSLKLQALTDPSQYILVEKQNRTRDYKTG
jgi:hypothetical protein